MFGRKARMDDAVIQMLRVSNLMDGDAYKAFLAAGYTSLPVTHKNEGRKNGG